MKLAGRAAITATVLLVLLGCAKSPLPPTVEGPDTCWANVPVTFHAQSSGASVAYCFGWGDGTRPKWTDYVPGVQKLAATHTFAAPGRYGVAVRAMDENGRESEWSAPHPLLVNYRAPGRPDAPAGPDSGYRNTEYAFATKTADSAGRKVRIRFDWGDGQTSGWSDSMASGVDVSISHVFEDTGSFTVRAQARTTAGDTSAWSFAHTISVAPGWDALMFDDFEGEFPGSRWALAGSPTWGPEDYRCYEGQQSAWCAGSSRNAPGYSKNMYAVMVYGPFSLTDVDSARVLFRDWVDTESDFDFFCWMASADGVNFGGYEVSGNFPYWVPDTFDLDYVPGVGNLVGRSKAWIAFLFYSDNSVQFDGVYVDSVALVTFTGFRNAGSVPMALTRRPVHGVRSSRAGVRPICARLDLVAGRSPAIEWREP